MNKELQAFVAPTGALQLEWNDTKEKVSKNSTILQDEIFNRYCTDENEWLLHLGFCSPKIQLSPSLNFLRRLAGLYTHKLIQTPELEELREDIEVLIADDELSAFLNSIPVMTGSEYLTEDTCLNIWNVIDRTFKDRIEAFDGTVEEFIKTFSPDIHLVGRVYFHLVENKKKDAPFAFLATYSTRLNRKGQSKHLPLKYALQEYADDNEKLLDLLTTVYSAAEKSDLITDLIASGELFHPLAWSAKDAFLFLKEIPIYENAGILCRIPNWWKNNSARISLNISLGDKKPSFVGMDALLSFNTHLMIGDTQISEAEARRLLEESEGLALIKNKWVAVDPEKLKQTLDAYDKAQKMTLNEDFNIKDALRMQLHPEQRMGTQLKDAQLTISRGKWLENVVEKLKNPALVSNAVPGRGFKAKLREYQQKGLNWLVFLHSLRFGACLADDMGLGKTIQLLAFLSIIKSEKIKNACLLILPASLISNWVGEIKRFLPNLNYFVAHPDAHFKKKVAPQNKDALDALDLVITTYTLAKKYEWLNNYTWEYVILDEAQAIKNPGTKQTLVIKELKSKNRIVLTGTPIENRLSDLWSLFDFLNPGLLGNKAEFARFAKTLKSDGGGYTRLRNVVMPYILRRMKTDKSIISDLPDKVEMKSYAPLSKKQIVLYRNIVRELEQTLIEKQQGIQRKGIILAALMKFKQLCNHPDQYLGTGEYNENESGKFARLRELCETIKEKREQMILFTQFKEMTYPLNGFLKEIFGRDGLVLHGSVPVGKRKKLIDRFQSDEYVPFMVLSLKAGGVGLNLTQANHVIHFDRWWNPAVENQATDRAFRIGQKKNVIVHKFITKGTIEEKIDNMLEEKSKLSQEIISSSSENWITEMENDELVDLFKLAL